MPYAPTRVAHSEVQPRCSCSERDRCYGRPARSPDTVAARFQWDPVTTPSRPLTDRRIVVLTSSLAPGYNDLWDAARPHVGALKVVGARSEDPRAAQGPDVVSLPAFDLGRGLVWQHLPGLRRAVKSVRADLVHVNRELWGVATQELLGLDTRIVVHGAENIWDHGNRVEQALRRRLVSRAVRRIDGYASWNRRGADDVRSLSRRLLDRELPTFVVPAVVPPREFRAERWQPQRVDERAPLRILLVGRMVAMKGFDDAIRASGRLEREVCVSLCGEGPETPRLREVAREEGVILRERGLIEPVQLAALMASAHVLLQPSLTTPTWAEQFGRSVAEAMTVGLPCLVSDSGELPNVVGRDPRAVFREGDVDHMVTLLEAVTRDADALRALSADQGSLARRWQPQVAAGAMLEFWSTCIS